MRNEKQLASLTEYCVSHPSERLWQAIRNWAGVSAVFVSKHGEEGYEDTFYWEDDVLNKEKVQELAEYLDSKEAEIVPPPDEKKLNPNDPSPMHDHPDGQAILCAECMTWLALQTPRVAREVEAEMKKKGKKGHHKKF